MGDFAIDTAIEGGDGRYTATLSRDWEIWGPNGGYIAAVLLRAAGAHSGLPRPATLAVHFLGSARFEEVQISTETLRAGRRSESIRVSMRQGDRPIAEAMAWTVSDDVAGPEHDWTAMPDAPGPEDLRPLKELLAEEGETIFPFWDNLELRPTRWLTRAQWEVERPMEPRIRGWFRFAPTPVFADPFVEAARVALLLDTEGWPAATQAMEPAHSREWMAPNMDLHVTFHKPPDGAAWLLCDAHAPLAHGGLIGATATVWSPDGRLLGTAIQQMMLRNMPSMPPSAAAASGAAEPPT